MVDGGIDGVVVVVVDGRMDEGMDKETDGYVVVVENEWFGGVVGRWAPVLDVFIDVVV